MDKTQKMIDTLSNYLSLMRYEYTAQEKLSRLKILEDYYTSEKLIPSTELLHSDIQSEEQLAKADLSLPLKVRGIFLTEGRPKRKYYTDEEIQKSVVNPVNKSFPLMLDHKDKEAGKVIGMVDRIEYDAEIKGIRWWGHVNDETFARNIMDGAIKEVSATIISATNFSAKYGIVGVNLTFKELSLVMEGAEPDNLIEVDN